MTERDGSAVHVHLVGIDAEHRRRVEGDRRERLVELDPLDVVDPLAGFLQRDLSRLGRRACEVREVVGDVRLGDDRRERLEAALLRELLAGDDESPAPSLTPGALPAVVVPSGSKTGFSDASFSSDVSRLGPSSWSSSPTGTISSSKRPSSCACTARSCERSAQAS